MNKSKGKIKKRSCKYHGVTQESPLDEFVLFCVDYKGRELYECKKCKISLDRACAHEERNRERQKLAFEKKCIQNKKNIELRIKSIRENMWDHYIERELLRGIKKSWLIQKIPKEVLQLKRATLLLTRSIEAFKKLPYKNLDINSKCSVHGKIDRRNFANSSFCARDRSAKNWG